MFCIVLKKYLSLCYQINQKQITLKTKTMNTQNTNFLTVASKTENGNVILNNNENQNTANAQKKIFTAADLWNVQRQGRTLFQRRRCA